MRREDRVSDAELDELLELGRQIRRLPDVVRARARARARVASAGAYSPSPTPMPATAMPVPRRRFRVALAASLALLVGAGGVAAAFRTGAFDRLAPSAPAATASAPPAPAVHTEPAPSPASARAKTIAHPHRPARAVTAQESYAAELRLLQRAQVAYAGRDFSEALVLVAEHARRFPTGRLTEEREALRVRSLASAGHGEQARRATAAFAARFPRSVLLPRLEKLAGAAE